jgi:hypothetical protein
MIKMKKKIKAYLSDPLASSIQQLPTILVATKAPTRHQKQSQRGNKQSTVVSRPVLFKNSSCSTTTKRCDGQPQHYYV